MGSNGDYLRRLWFVPNPHSSIVILKKHTVHTMTKEKEDHINRAFSLEDTFPDADNLFSNDFRSIQDSYENALFVLDTNILLLPFNLGKEAIDEIEKIYKKLIDENKLFIPKRVAREYSKNRTAKLSEIHSNILRLKAGRNYQNIKYPILENLPEKIELDESLKDLKDKESEFHSKVTKLTSTIKEWGWKDPVSTLYGELFKKEILIGTKKTREEILTELNRRQKHKIPPGYKDSSKDDSGVGDLVIWLSILELGKNESKDIIFVSQDLKPDWWQQSSGSAFLPRFELIEEYKRTTSGQNIHIITFSYLLELFKASEQAIEALKQEEERNRKQRQKKLFKHYKKIREQHKKRLKKLSRDEIIEEIKEWFFQNFEDPVESLPYESKEGGYIYIWGGPYEARDEIESEYGGIVTDSIIDEVATELEEISWEWSGHPEEHRDDYRD